MTCLYNPKPHENAIIRIAVDLSLFKFINDKKKRGASAEELEAITGANYLLIGLYIILDDNDRIGRAAYIYEVRIMRVLTALGIFAEIDEERYAATPISQAWDTPALLGGTQSL